MTAVPLQVLLIDTPDHASRFRDAFQRAPRVRELDPSVELTVTEDLVSGMHRLERGGIDLLFLNLAFRGSIPVDTLARVRRNYPGVPVVALTVPTDEPAGIQAVLTGAQDYLVKGQLTGDTIRRTIRYVMARRQLAHELEQQILQDTLTGLPSRRGFFLHAEHQLKIAHRTRGHWLLFCDVEGLRHINVKWGQREGDAALLATAGILRRCVRDSDIVARLGGDEFAVLLVDAVRDGAGIVVERLHRRVAEHNARPNATYKLKLTVGKARCEPKVAVTPDQLLAAADDDAFQRKSAPAA